MSSAPPYERQVNDDAPYAEYSDKQQLTDPRFDFSEATIRRGFIRKVYCILMCQLAVTTAIVGVFKWQPQTKEFVSMNAMPLFLGSIMVTFPILIVLACFREIARKAPLNLIMLLIFTLGQSVVVGIGTIAYDDMSVIIALGLTAVVCFGLTLFAFQSKYDFTGMGGYLFVGLLILIVVGLIAALIPGQNTGSTLIAGAGVFLFSLYLIYDTQLMLGGNHKYAISPEDYIFAALNLYLDILNLFLEILRLVGAARQN